MGEPLITLNGDVRRIGKRLLFSELERGWDCNLKAILTEDKKYIYDYNAVSRPLTARLKSAWKRDWRYLFNSRELIEKLFDTQDDPRERINLISMQPSSGRELKQKLDEWIASSHRYPTSQVHITLSDEMEEQLKALGYISPGGKEKEPSPPKDCAGCKPAASHSQQ